MGANAQTTVPTFTAAQVLTADQMNQSARTGVPVFADTTARDAAFGGTGEKTLAEGQLCYLESTNVVQYYDGAAWATVGPATSGALVFITGAAFSAVASVSAPANTFTSTYTNYLIVVDISAISTTMNILLRWRASGTDTTSANYFTMQNRANSGATASQIGVSSGTSHTILSGADNAGVYAHGFQLTAYAPQLARATLHTGQGVDGSTPLLANFGGTINLTTVFDAFTLLTSTGNMTGNYRVYGYVNS
jgi:hypothetical protein